MPVASGWLTKEKDMIGKPIPFVVALALAASPVMAQQQSQKPDPSPRSGMQSRHQETGRQAWNNARAMEYGSRQAWLDSLDNQAKLHARLAEAWQQMGLSPQQAKKVADRYDPAMATQMHHTPMRGKTDQEVASLLQSALAAERYQVANQLLIDYQRARLSLAEMATADSQHVLIGL